MATNLLLDPGRERVRLPPALAGPGEPSGTGADVRAPPPTRTALSALSLSWQEHEDLLQIALEGDLDTYTVPLFRGRVDRLDPAEVQLVIDLSGVRRLDSAGLSALLSLRNRAQREGAQLGLVCASLLARLFWVTGLRPAFACGDDLVAVRAALAAGGAARSPPPPAGELASEFCPVEFGDRG
jgi:anti-anti-sigma factor